MGCGCKNKSNQNSQQVQESSSTNESIKSAIKKTVEKYYYGDKKSNGWVK